MLKYHAFLDVAMEGFIVFEWVVTKQKLHNNPLSVESRNE